MLQKRIGGTSDEPLDGGPGLAAAAGTLRAAADAAANPPADKKEEEKMSLFWRVFGGTILSIVALVSVTLFNNISGSLVELRAEIGREREARSALVRKDEVAGLRAEVTRLGEARSEFVRKDEWSSRSTSMWERIRAVEGLAPTVAGVKTECDGMKEKVAANVTAVEALRKDLAGLEVMRERLTLVAAEARAGRDELTAVKQDVDRNKVNDLERKQVRDAQHKDVTDALKELQKGLQDCREKLARLEGAGPKPPAPKSAEPNTKE